MLNKNKAKKTGGIEQSSRYDALPESAYGEAEDQTHTAKRTKSVWYQTGHAYTRGITLERLLDSPLAPKAGVLVRAREVVLSLSLCAE